MHWLLLYRGVRPGSDGNEGVLHIPQSSSITGTSPSNCLVSYLGDSLGRVLHLCREAVCVFYSPSRLGKINVCIINCTCTYHFIQIRERQIWFDICGSCDYRLSCFSLSLDDNHKDLVLWWNILHSLSIIWTDYISDYMYSEHSAIPVLASVISSMPHYSLSVLLYLSCNKTLFLLSTSVLTVPFRLSTTLSDCITFKETTLREWFSYWSNVGHYNTVIYRCSQIIFSLTNLSLKNSPWQRRYSDICSWKHAVTYG